LSPLTVDSDEVEVGGGGFTFEDVVVVVVDCGTVSGFSPFPTTTQNGLSFVKSKLYFVPLSN
jgi:hypothetical protein